MGVTTRERAKRRAGKPARRQAARRLLLIARGGGAHGRGKRVERARARALTTDVIAPTKVVGARLLPVRLRLLLYTIHARLDPSAPHHMYARHCPQEYEDPLWWSETELSELQKRLANEKIERLEDTVLQLMTHLPKVSLSLPAGQKRPSMRISPRRGQRKGGGTG